MTQRPELKRITREGVIAALQKAHRYRVLNDSVAAESICLDVLAVDPTNVDAIVTHILSITDQFPAGHAADRTRAEGAVGALSDKYRVAYYSGVICERWANGLLRRAGPRSGEMAYDWIAKALDWYAKAESLRPAGNDEAILRWNACVRLMQREPSVKAREAEAWEPSLE